jgi:DNA-binding beta-propeller fold protein YncE
LRPGRAAATLALCLLLAGCAAHQPFREHSPGRGPAWSPPALSGEITWFRSIGNYPDAGITPGFWKSLASFLFGGEETEIGRPYGVLMDDGDRLLVVDAGRRLVHVMDTRGNRYDVIGKREGQPVFQTPIGIASDGEGHLYITDSEAGTVYRYDLAERLLSPFIVNLMRPTGIAYNRTNRLLYVSETAAHQIVVFDLKGRERHHIGRRGEGPGQLNYPTDLFIDRAGVLYVTDPINARIQVMSAAGAFIRSFGRAGDAPGEFSKPKGVAVDAAGHIYVCDALRDSVQVFDPTGRLLVEFGTQGQEDGAFWMPSGLYIDDSGMIYVADTYNRRIQVFRYRERRLPGPDAGAPPPPAPAQGVKP